MKNNTIEEYAKKAEIYLKVLCDVKPNRSTGSAGNKKATDYFAGIVKANAYQIETNYFDCMDFKDEKIFLRCKSKYFSVYTSPFSLGCNIESELVVVSNINELEKCNCEGKILLIKDKICAEPLMPKNFVFYNPEHHKRIYSLLEAKKPAAIITAVEPKPELIGAIYPYPLIEDGDFDIPSCYCDKAVGEKLSSYDGKNFELNIEAMRISAKACNVIARKNPGADKKIVICAHIDARASTPGATDNASGTTVLLLLAEMLADYQGANCIEIIAFNGEDHYSVAGQMDYLKRYQQELNKISLAINIDEVGYKKGKTSYSFYQCSDQTKKLIKVTLSKHKELTEGESWYSGDHMIFIQNSIETIALTSSATPFLMKTITHTEKDIPNIIKFEKLAEIADALKDIVLNFDVKN